MSPCHALLTHNPTVARQRIRDSTLMPTNNRRRIVPTRSFYRRSNPPAFRAAARRGAEVVATPLAQPQLPPTTQRPPRPHQPPRREKRRRGRNHAAVNRSFYVTNRRVCEVRLAMRNDMRHYSRPVTSLDRSTNAPDLPSAHLHCRGSPIAPHPQPHRRQTEDQRQHADAREQSATEGWHAIILDERTGDTGSTLLMRLPRREL